MRYTWPAPPADEVPTHAGLLRIEWQPTVYEIDARQAQVIHPQPVLTVDGRPLTPEAAVVILREMRDAAAAEAEHRAAEIRRALGGDHG